MIDRIKALEDALRRCVYMLDALVTESGREIDWGHEDAFRMGEWFEAGDLQALADARAALAASQPAPDCHQPDLVTADSRQPAQPVAVNVKPLVWIETNNGNHKKGEVFSARSLIDFAPIAAHRKHDGWWLNMDCKTYPTLEAAEAAAQADYEARIMAALDVQPLTAQDAARRILSDDIAISHMAQALHDGPLGADDHWFSAARPQGAWCVDAVRVVLRAIAEGRE